MDRTTLKAVGEVLKEERANLVGRLEQVDHDIQSKLSALRGAVAEARTVADQGLKELRAEDLAPVFGELIRDSDEICRLREMDLNASTVIDDLGSQVEAFIAEQAKEMDRIGRKLAALTDEDADLAESLRAEMALQSEVITQELDDTYKTVLADIEQFREKHNQALDSLRADLIKSVRAEVKDGADGQDGIDRYVVAPRPIEKGEAVERNDLVVHAGGLFQAVRKAIGGPSDDPASFVPVVQGVAELDGRLDTETREVVMTCRLSDGEQHRLAFPDLPRYIDPAGKDVPRVSGDFCIEGDHLKVWNGEDFDLHKVVGPKGQRGRTGKQGKPGVGIEHVEMAGTALMVLLTDGTQKEFLLDALMPPPEQVDQSIRRFAGTHRAGASYDVGDVVGTPDGLFLALRDTSDDPHNTKSWTRMVSSRPVTAVTDTSTGGKGATATPATSSHIGEIKIWPTTTPPPDHLICDGSPIPAQYTELIALVGADTPDLRSQSTAGGAATHGIHFVIRAA